VIKKTLSKFNKMLHHQHHLNIHLHEQLRKFREGIYTLYLVHSTKSFVSSLIGFFIPIYLLTIDFSLVQVLWFFVLRYLSAIIFVPIAGLIGNRLGLKHTMMISLPLFLAYLIGIMSLEKFPNTIFLYTLSIFVSFVSALYWIPLHSLFARFSSKKKSGNQVSMLISLRSLSAMLAPLIGGLVSIYFGFEVLFGLAILILIIPTVLLFQAKDIHPHINFSVNDLWKIAKKHSRHFVTIALDAFGSFAEEILWPLFVYLILLDTFSVGVVGSLIGVGTIIFTILVGRIVGKKNYFTVIQIAAFVLSIVWIIRFFANEQITIYTASLLAGIFAMMFSVPLLSHTYQIAKQDKNLDEVIVFKEMVGVTSKLIAALVTLLLVYKLNITFLIAGISYLMVTIL